MSDQKQNLYAGRFVNLVRRGRWEYAERVNTTGIVGIIAVTQDSRIVLVEQFRPPAQRNVIELPAGLAGDVAGQELEALQTAARRELAEETGYEAAHWQQLVTAYPSAGITDEATTLFLARDLRKTGPGEGDGNESITVHEVPLSEIDIWLEQQVGAGKGVDFKVYAGLYFLKDQ